MEPVKLQAVDIKQTTRVTVLAEAWVFVMDKLEGLDLHSINITAQDWKADDSSDWVNTFLVEVSGRMKEPT